MGIHYIEARDFACLDSVPGLLNDVCLNASTALLQDMFSREERYASSTNVCAIFSTHDLPRIHYKTPDNNLWRNVRRLEYWNKKIWIVPIHIPLDVHWVLAVVYLESGTIRLFDSLGKNQRWESVTKVSWIVLHADLNIY